jgi:HEPN domain-containing protein/predicted nucleotidyltransferase
MKTSLDHLPIAKQRELDVVLKILFEEFAAAMAHGTSQWKKDARILKVILFGSFARGTWVEDHHSGYKSDFDILVIVNSSKVSNPKYWYALDDRLMFHPDIQRDVQIIVEPLSRVNDELAKGQYFFSDIKKDGIALYELKGHSKLADARSLNGVEYKKLSEKYYEHSFDFAKNMLVTAGFNQDRQAYNMGVFLLHQACEHAYRALLLTLTHYAPGTHNIGKLRGFAEDLDMRLVDIWPRYHHADKRRFELLKKAYVEARYSVHYEISKEDLNWLIERVQVLLDKVGMICEEQFL